MRWNGFFHCVWLINIGRMSTVEQFWNLKDETRISTCVSRQEDGIVNVTTTA